MARVPLPLEVQVCSSRGRGWDSSSSPPLPAGQRGWPCEFGGHPHGRDSPCQMHLSPLHTGRGTQPPPLAFPPASSDPSRQHLPSRGRGARRCHCTWLGGQHASLPPGSAGSSELLIPIAVQGPTTTGAVPAARAAWSAGLPAQIWSFSSQLSSSSSNTHKRRFLVKKKRKKETYNMAKPTKPSKNVKQTVLDSAYSQIHRFF